MKKFAQCHIASKGKIQDSYPLPSDSRAHACNHSVIFLPDEESPSSFHIHCSLKSCKTYLLLSVIPIVRNEEVTDDLMVSTWAD